LYLLSGDGSVEVDGVVSALTAETVTHVAAGQTKALRNVNGSAPLRVLAFLVLDRDKPSFQLAESARPDDARQKAPGAVTP
jgi:hypothetical protein